MTGSIEESMFMKAVAALVWVCFLVALRPAAIAEDLLHIRQAGGGGSGLMMEFRVDDSGRYDLRKRVNPDETGEAKFEERRGQVATADVLRLIAHIKDAPEGPKADDVGSAEFEWWDHGKKQSRIFLFPARSPCSELLAELDKLARGTTKKN